MERQKDLSEYEGRITSKKCKKNKNTAIILKPEKIGNIEFPDIDEDNDKDFNWSKYNRSQDNEAPMYCMVGKDLTNLVIDDIPKCKKGRKRRKKSEIIYSLLSRIYDNISFRRSGGKTKILKKAKYIDYEMPFSTLLDNLKDSELTDILLELIEISSLPLRGIEEDFTIDATGFGVHRYQTYYNWKYKKKSKMKVFKKVHAVCGVKTKIATAVVVTDGDVHDNTQFEELVINTARNFKIKELSADKAYLASKNFNLIKSLGGLAFIPFKINSSGKCAGGNSYIFKTMLKIFLKHNDYFMKKYHKRSNAESLNSMLKRKFGNHIRCKHPIAQINELLGMILANNICILIKEIYLNDLDIDFNECLKTYNERK